MEAAGAFQGIYTNLAAVELTNRLIAERPVWQIPAMNRALVEGATHPERIAALLAEKGADWQAYDRQFSGAAMVARQLGQNHVLPATARSPTWCFRAAMRP